MKGTPRKYFEILSEIVSVLEILLLFLTACQLKPKPSIKGQFPGCRQSLLGAEVPLWCAQIDIPVCKAPPVPCHSPRAAVAVLFLAVQKHDQEGKGLSQLCWHVAASPGEGLPAFQGYHHVFVL